MNAFQFEQSPWEAFLDTCKNGAAIPAWNLISMLEEEDDEAVEEAFQIIQEKQMLLDLSSLPRTAPTGQAAQRLKLTAQDALELGIIEAILTERDLGQTSFYSRLAGRLEEELRTLQAQKNLLETRYARFRAFGRPKTSCPTE